jgi:hypothetical protein
MGDDDELRALVETYERLAADAEAQANNVLSLGMRIGWDESSMETEARLRQSAEASRILAQEVRDGMGDGN